MKYYLFILFFFMLLITNCVSHNYTQKTINETEDAVFQQYETEADSIKRIWDIEDKNKNCGIGGKKHNMETYTETTDSITTEATTAEATSEATPEATSEATPEATEATPEATPEATTEATTETTKKLNKNNGVMYHAKYDTMYVGVPKRITFVISKKLLNKTHKIKIFNTTELKTTKIKITNDIRVELIDPDEKFKIKYIGIDTKQHLDSLLTSWEWSVTPLTEGNAILTICVDVFIDGTGQTTRYNDNIIVISNDTIVNKIYRFFAKYWQWTIGTFFLPLSIFLWKNRKEKKKRNT